MKVIRVKIDGTMNDLDVSTLRKEQQDKKKLKNLKKIQTTNIQPILNLPYK